MRKEAPVRGRIGLIVERDGEIGTPRRHADSDDGRIGNDDGRIVRLCGAIGEIRKQRQSGATTGPPTLSE